jgi:mono/diheme cytochrome c family protein
MVRPFAVLLFTVLPVLAGDAPRPPKDLEALRAFYAENCVRCHGTDGSAVGVDGKRLKGADFTDAKSMAKEKDASLAKTVLKGLFFGQKMPSFKDQLSEDDALRLVQEVVRKAEKGKAIGPRSGAK